MQVGAADGQESHIVLMSVKNTERKITTRQPRLGRIKQMEPLCNNSVHVLHFPQLPKKKLLLFIC